MGPLHQLTVGLSGSAEPYRVAAGLLAGLGARVGGAGEVRLGGGGPGGGGRPGARLIRAPRPCPEAGLPAGTVARATGLALAAAALAGWRAGASWEVHELAVAVEVWLPEVMAAAYSAPPVMRPHPPAPAPGGGWLHLDLGAPGDGDAYRRLLGTLPPDASAPAVAAAAQEWRLAVCDYRPLRAGRPRPPMAFRSSAGRPPRPPRALEVCDLTSMWAGPLATRLLQDLGATVHKVEPAFRPDGMRALSGGGIHPGGRQVAPGRDSAMWNALNPGKRHVDLDLRRSDHADAFLDLVATCDVVIDSFSPRVMPNFGLEDRIEGDPLRVSMPAFGPGPRRDWVAYGTGVHALSGLGDSGRGSFRAPAVSYPDPTAGFTGALAVLAAAAGRDLGIPVRRVEATLAGSTGPLAAHPRAGPMTPADPDTGAGLLGAARAGGLVELRPVGGVLLAHPTGPFRPEAGC